MAGGLVSLTGQVAALQSFATVAKNATINELEDSLKRSALELEAKIKEGIAANRLGLAPNTDLTQRLKGGNIPLIDTGQMWQNITTSDLITKAEGVDADEFRAYFVGVKRTAPMHRPRTTELGTPKTESLYNIARKQVRGYTVTLPRTGVKKKVPARDFRKKPYQDHKKRHKELMKSAVHQALTVGISKGRR
jgi:hypothetical protein